MLFNSLTYLLFLLVVVMLYWSFSCRARQFLIFLSSLIFYGFWKIEFLALLLIVTAIDWRMALVMNKYSNNSRLYLLFITLFIQLGFLFYFKYSIFFVDNGVNLAQFIGIELSPKVLNIILPLGISFYTFQSISYIVDVYRRSIKPETSYLIYACYMTFFPQLVAGPILRANEVIPQFKNYNKFNLDNFNIGGRLIINGLFLKVVLADSIAPLVDDGYSMPLASISALDVWTLAFLFGFQIYFDFSAYSQIAIGSAKLLGISFPSNFNFPYLATSPKKFWERWHISLSSWIRDYLYAPLTGIKNNNNSTKGLTVVTDIKKIKSLFLTWGIMGFWHGANWTFILWGIYHAVIIVCYRLIKNYSKISFGNSILNSIIGFAITLPIIMLGWIPFRANSIFDTFNMWAKIFDPFSYTWLGMKENTYIITFLILLGILITFLFNKKILPYIKIKFYFIFIVSEILTLALVLFFVIIFFKTTNQFIYFQF